MQVRMQANLHQVAYSELQGCGMESLEECPVVVVGVRGDDDLGAPRRESNKNLAQAHLARIPGRINPHESSGAVVQDQHVADPRGHEPEHSTWTDELHREQALQQVGSLQITIAGRLADHPAAHSKTSGISSSIAGPVGVLRTPTIRGCSSSTPTSTGSTKACRSSWRSAGSRFGPTTMT